MHNIYSVENGFLFLDSYVTDSFTILIQEDGGEVGGHQLCDDLSLQHNRHDHKLLLFDQVQILDCEHGQVSVLRQKV